MVESFAVNGELTVTIILLKIISSKFNTPSPWEGSPLIGQYAIRHRIGEGEHGRLFGIGT